MPSRYRWAYRPPPQTEPDLAGAALLGQRLVPDLAGGDSGRQQRRVQGIAVDVQPGRGGAWIGGLERVFLLDGAIGLDDHHRAGARPTISEPMAPPSRRCMISSNKRIRVCGVGYQ